MDQEAKDTAERLEAILESSVDGIFAIDERGTIQYANSAALETFGYEAPELIGQKVNLLMPSPDRERHDGYMQAYLETGVAKIIGIGREVVGLRKDGTEFPHYLTISDGSLNGSRIFTGIIRDLTEIRRIEERAKSAERLAALSVISAGIAHDIGTPMNVILGYADMLRDSLENPKDRRRAEVISEQVRRVTELLQTLLNIARPSEALRIRVQVDQVMAHALDFFQEKLRKRSIEVEKRFDPVPELQGDPDRLEQVFLNLIVNAADAMPRGGKLTITIDGSEPEWIKIEVMDTGEGIDPEARSKIFDPFYTTKDRGKGTGLGLVVTKSIVSDHRGTIVCESELGSGTRFIIRLPIVAAAEP